MSEDIRLLPSVRQLLHSKIAQFCVETKGSDLYHLMEAIDILRANIGDEPLKEFYKESYDEKRMQLEYLKSTLIKVKMYYDSIKDFDEASKEQRLKRLFRKELSRIPMIHPLMFKVFTLLVERTELRFLPIPNDYFKRMEKSHKKIEPEHAPRPPSDENA